MLTPNSDGVATNRIALTPMVKHASEAGTSSAAGERLPAVWPWLLIPLVALALFFILRTVRGES